MNTVAFGGAVRNFIWRNGRPASEAELLMGIENANCLDAVSGQFAAHMINGDGTHTLVRDSLGVNKLFFTLDAGGNVQCSSYKYDLVNDDGREVWSVPAGHLIRIDSRNRTLKLDRWSKLSFPLTSSLDAAVHGVRIRARLREVFTMIRSACAGRPLYVTLSGGLDSTVIAALASEMLGDVTAVTFVLDPDPAATQECGADPDSDCHHARRVAEFLGIPWILLHVNPEEVLTQLDCALIRGQDFRDFNVHCALVNAAIAKALAARHETGPRPIVLTGDVMNELLADYSAETHRGRIVYRLPRLPRGRLRRHLVNGLDAGDREVGIFHQYGVDVIQPYALCADVYADLPDDAVDSREAKATLARSVMGDMVPEFVYARGKVRAQVGSVGGGGTMALLLDRGIDGAWLERRFGAIFRSGPISVRRSIRAGRYRFPTAYPALGA